MSPRWRSLWSSAAFLNASVISTGSEGCPRTGYLICELVVFADENCRAKHRGPQAALVADRGLRHVHRAHDLVRNSVDFFFFIKRQVRVELDIQRRRQHFRRQLFRVFTRDFLGLAEGMVL